jgi:hypothetical protein
MKYKIIKNIIKYINIKYKIIKHKFIKYQIIEHKIGDIITYKNHKYKVVKDHLGCHGCAFIGICTLFNPPPDELIPCDTGARRDRQGIIYIKID